MGILDGISFDPASLRHASEAATPGWLGLALSSPGVAPALAGAGQALANAPADPSPSPVSGAAPQAAAANPFAALFGAPGQSAVGPGLGERANAAVMNFLNGHGVLPAIAGAIAGATTGGRSDPAGVVQAQQAATVRALVGAGITPEVAQAAAQHPDFMRLIAPQLVLALQRKDAALAPLPAEAAAPAPRQAPSTAAAGKE